ncbi:MAG: hypothetical protein V4722_25840 [Bacteroidota bacterium]
MTDRKLCIAAFIAMVGLISCSGAGNETYTPPINNEGNVYQQQSPAAVDSSFIRGIQTGNPYGVTSSSPVYNPQGNTVNATPTQAQTQSATVAPGMNPPHGQPGHRCDIVEGAPLDSKPTVNPATTVAATHPISNPAGVTTNPPQAIQPAAAGMNPAHGQPGHRCDISVGAPLNSKPIVNPATTAAATKASPKPAIATTTTTPPQAVAPGMNPAHGQPGHRCDISVGAPLNSAPTTPAAATTTTPPAAVTPVKTDSTKQ